MNKAPPNFRLAKLESSTDSCRNCVYFYLTKGWKGLGECMRWEHITDESLLCDSHTNQDKIEALMKEKS